MYTVQFAVQSKVTGAPTEKRCEWNNSSRNKVKTAPLSDVSFKKIKLEGEKYNRNSEMVPTLNEKNPPINAQQLAGFRKIIPNAAIWTSWTDDSGTDSGEEECLAMPPSMIEIFQAHEITDLYSLAQHFDETKIKNLEVQTRSQRSLLWKEHRRGRLTASNFGKILRRKSLTPQFLQTFINFPEEINVKQIVWGRKNEVKAFQAYCRTEKMKHQSFSVRKAGIYISHTDPYLGCSPDGVISCSCCEGFGVLEIKCPFKLKNVDPKQIAARDEMFCLDVDGSLKENHEYYAQVQGQMAVTKAKYCDFLIYTTIDIYVCRVRFDEVFWKTKKPVLKAFFFDNIAPALKNLK